MSQVQWWMCLENWKECIYWSQWGTKLRDRTSAVWCLKDGTSQQSRFIRSEKLLASVRKVLLSISPNTPLNQWSSVSTVLVILRCSSLGNCEYHHSHLQPATSGLLQRLSTSEKSLEAKDTQFSAAFTSAEKTAWRHHLCQWRREGACAKRVVPFLYHPRHSFHKSSIMQNPTHT